jgi:hypothetical protein
VEAVVLDLVPVQSASSGAEQQRWQAGMKPDGRVRALNDIVADLLGAASKRVESSLVHCRLSAGA